MSWGGDALATSCSLFSLYSPRPVPVIFRVLSGPFAASPRHRAGRTDRITICNQDSPLGLARKFGRAWKLDADKIAHLKQLIASHMEAAGIPQRKTGL